MMQRTSTFHLHTSAFLVAVVISVQRPFEHLKARSCCFGMVKTCLAFAGANSTAGAREREGT